LLVEGVSDISQPPLPPHALPAAVGAVKTLDPRVIPVELTTPVLIDVAVHGFGPYAVNAVGVVPSQDIICPHPATETKSSNAASKDL